MYMIRGKLSTGDTISGTIPATNGGTAVAAVVAKLPEGITLEDFTIKNVGDGELDIRAPRKAKGGDATPAAPAVETPAAPAAETPAAPAPAASGKKK